VRILIAESPAGAAGDDNWPSVAEAAAGALYALHPRPHAVAGAVLQRLAAASGVLDGGFGVWGAAAAFALALCSFEEGGRGLCGGGRLLASYSQNIYCFLTA